MQSSIVDLENLRREVSRRQTQCHAKGISFVAVDSGKKAIIEFLPNGIEEILGSIDIYSEARASRLNFSDNSKAKISKLVENH